MRDGKHDIALLTGGFFGYIVAARDFNAPWTDALKNAAGFLVCGIIACAAFRFVGRRIAQ